MGLDSVELLIEVEKAFDIEIPDSEAREIGTVGDFYEVVWSKINGKEIKKCSTAMLFYKFRRFLRSKYEFLPKDFKPNTNLNELLPKDFRKNRWKELQQEFEYKLPDLELPVRIKDLLRLFGGIIVIGALVYALITVNFYDASKASFFLPFLGLFLMIAISYILKPFRTDVDQENVRQFIETILTLNYNKIRLTFGANRAEMEKVINELIHDKIGVDYEEIKPEASLVNDLGIN